jgi:hypothetical protein
MDLGLKGMSVIGSDGRTGHATRLIAVPRGGLATFRYFAVQY